MHHLYQAISHQLISWVIIDKAWILVPQKYFTNLFREISLTCTAELVPQNLYRRNISPTNFVNYHWNSMDTCTTEISHHLISWDIIDIAWILVPSHHITSHHITSHHITSHQITSHHITSYHITSHHITSHHITCIACVTCITCINGINGITEITRILKKMNKFLSVTQLFFFCQWPDYFLSVTSWHYRFKRC